MSDATSRSAVRMFFIVGRGRSGTTLVSTYLNAIPGIVIAPECMFIMNLRRAYASGLFTPERIHTFCRDVFLEQRMRNWAFGRSELTDFMLARYERHGIRNFAEASRLVYEAQAHFSGVADPIIVGDKNPHYSLFMPELAELFQDAPFLHIVRDPRANVVSYRRVKFDYFQPDILAGRWNIYNETIRCASLGLASRYHRIRFEDFVHDPAATIATILDFIGMTHEDRPEAARQVADHIAKKPWHPKLGSNLDPRVIDEWREQMHADHVQIVEGMCIDLMEHFGYESDSGPGAFAKTPFGAAWRARLTVAAERSLFALPMRLRSTIMTLYRKLTSTL